MAEAQPLDAETTPPAGRPGGRLLRTPLTQDPRGQALLAFLGYLAVSILLWGLPVLGRMSRTYVGDGQGDAKIYVWSLAWWPHALATGLNPFTARVIWAPHGIDLAWVTSVPGPALAAWPVTALFGPVVSSNMWALLAPALAAWAAYLVCRRVTGRLWASIAGGYLFGFSTYMAGQMRGHLNLFLVFPVPLAVYLVLRRMDGSLGRGRFVALTAATLVGQFTISTEVFASMALFGGIALLGAYLFGSVDLRPRLHDTVRLLLIGGAVAAVVLGPFIYYIFVGLGDLPPLKPLSLKSVDLLSFLVPRDSTLIGGRAFAHFTGRFRVNTTEDGAYLGIPLIAALALAALSRRRDRVDRLLLAFAGVAALASLGPELHIDGRSIVPLPWAAVEHIPILQHALPQRFTLYLWLSVAVLVARWLARMPAAGWRRSWAWGLVALGAVSILPNIASERLRPPVQVPPFFAKGLDRRYLQRGETVLLLHDSKGEDMLWQAASNFRFRVAEGHTGNEPPAYRSDPTWQAIRDDHPEAISPGSMSGFLCRHGVRAVVVEDAVRARWEPTLSGLVGSPVRVGGVTLFQIDGGTSAPSCPNPVGIAPPA